MMNIKLINDQNINNYRWLVVINSKEVDTHFRDFHYFKYKIQYLFYIIGFKLFWSSYNPETLFIQTYDMHNLKKYKPGKITKELIKSGYFEKYMPVRKPRF